MERNSNNEHEVENGTFTSEYNKIVNFSEKSVVIETQWQKKGDFFQKLTMYDDSYIPVETLGSTTLINSL